MLQNVTKSLKGKKYAICSHMDAPRDSPPEQNKADGKSNIFNDTPRMRHPKRNDTNEHNYKTKTDSQTCKMNLTVSTGE